MTDEEILLIGGNVTQVVRIGNTVHRVMGSWSSTVHDLLRYLEARGFNSSPRMLGIDEQGREVLTFIEGEVGNYPLPLYMWSDRVLTEAAQFLRRYHEAVEGYIPQSGAVWQFEYPDPHLREVICHNDFAPYNMVFVDQSPRAILDFDIAGPGPRVWDAAYAAYRFVPLIQPEDTELQRSGLADPMVQGRRLQLFCDAYGLARPREVLEMVEPRLQAMCATLIGSAAAGNVAFQRMIEEGHLDHYRREIESFQWYRPRLEQNLSS